MNNINKNYSYKIQQVNTPPKNGNCVGRPLHLFFPHTEKNDEDKDTFAKRYRQARSDTEFAKSICDQCHVVVQCLSYSLYHESHGIWGGLTERERQTMRRRQNIKAVPKEPIGRMVQGMNLR